MYHNETAYSVGDIVLATILSGEISVVRFKKLKCVVSEARMVGAGYVYKVRDLSTGKSRFCTPDHLSLIKSKPESDTNCKSIW